MQINLRDKYAGCLLGSLLGDVAGAVVEGEMSGLIKKQYNSITEILAEDQIRSSFGDTWNVGHFTDDTQMMIGIINWLLGDEFTGDRLLQEFVNIYEPWRRYGSSTIFILEKFRESTDDWEYLNRRIFPSGSYGNGAAMRIAPVGLKYHNNQDELLKVAINSAMPTHYHPQAIIGAVMQSSAVAIATGTGQISRLELLAQLKDVLKILAKDFYVGEYEAVLELIEKNLGLNTPAVEMAVILGNGVAAIEAVPMALYCFLQNMGSYVDTISDAVFSGGDTDTIAAMAGAISGAYLGQDAIPADWLSCVKEQEYTPAKFQEYVERLLG